jgi:hypothetical protein
MYRSGLGDCFLVSFLREEKTHHVLIDCGVLQGTPDGVEIMRKIVRSIRRTTKKKLDLLIPTHEHWDHLSGFVQAQDLFDGMQIDRIWLAWTEDPADQLASELREEHALMLQSLKTALARMPEDMGIARRGLFGLLNFFGEPLAAAGVSGARQALDYLAGRTDASISFCRPADPFRTLDDLPGVRFFVLGPPVDEKMLMKTNPSKKNQEGYGLLPETYPSGGFLQALEALKGQPGAARRDLPFEEHSCIPLEEARQMAFFQQFYGFEETAGHGDAWRRIDADWLAAAGELALDLDSATNNTSLVLAVELVDSGRVLLFPADAQAGSWLSWGELEWQVAGSGGELQTVTGLDLLKRTVFYKVAHHGSHNATLRAKGLEKMESAELQAMIPVSREKVEQLGWNMPFPALFARLQEKTHGRVIRLDDGVPSQPAAIAGSPPPEAAEWQDFQRRSSEKPLYVDLYFD